MLFSVRVPDAPNASADVVTGEDVEANEATGVIEASQGERGPPERLEPLDWE